MNQVIAPGHTPLNPGHGPQDQDALACLAGVLEGTYRFTEAQQVRLLAAGARPDQTRIDALGQVTSVALAVVLILNAAIPIMISTQDHSSAATDLGQLC